MGNISILYRYCEHESKTNLLICNFILHFLNLSCSHYLHYLYPLSHYIHMTEDYLLKICLVKVGLPIPGRPYNITQHQYHGIGSKISTFDFVHIAQPYSDLN